MMEYIKLFWEDAPEEFHACVIEQAEFEAAWESHTYDGALK